MADMHYERYSGGLCYIGNFIYAIGGGNANHASQNTIERFNVLTGKWSKLPNEIPGRTSFSMALGVAKRFVYCFGGSNNLNITETAGYMDRVMRLDTSNVSKAIQVLHLKTPLDQSGL